MGCGDVKLAVALGFFLGPVGSLISLFYAAVFGAFSGVLVMLSGGGKREQGFTKFAFGPYICLGTLLVTFVGPDLALEIYLKFSGLLVWMLTGKELI
jgi:prepilin signal peptidase PulO-like enzyme (type II secretory pathway)